MVQSILGSRKVVTAGSWRPVSHLASLAGDMARGILWDGGELDMTGCLECPLTRPVLAQNWCQSATDGAWYSTTALSSGRDRSLSLSVLRRRAP